MGSQLAMMGCGKGASATSPPPPAGPAALLVAPGGGFLLNSTGGKILVSITPPVFTSPNSDTFYIGHSGVFTPSAIGYGYTPSFTMSGPLPGGVTFNAGILSGTATAGVGTYNDIITANAGLAATQAFTLTVTNPVTMLDATFGLAGGIDIGDDTHLPLPINQGQNWLDVSFGGGTPVWNTDGLGNVSVGTSSGTGDGLFTSYGIYSRVSGSVTFKTGTTSGASGILFSDSGGLDGLLLVVDITGIFTGGTLHYKLMDMTDSATDPVLNIASGASGTPTIGSGNTYIPSWIISSDSLTVSVSMNGVFLGAYSPDVNKPITNASLTLYDNSTSTAHPTQFKRVTVIHP